MTDKTSESRLSGLEATLLALAQTVDRYIAASVDAAKVLAEQRRLERTEWQEAVKPIGRANWPLYLSAVGIVLVIGTAVLAPMFSSQTELTRIVNEHKQLPVHPVAAEQLQEIFRRLKIVEEKLDDETKK